MRENRTCGSEGGEGQNPFRPLYPLAARKGRLRAELRTTPLDSLIVRSVLKDASGVRSE